MTTTPRQHAAIIANARVVTPPPGQTPRKGAAMAELLIYPRAHVHVHHGVIERIEPACGLESPSGPDVIDLRGNVLLPAFVDCHTHHCWAGSRIDEWEAKLAGASYLDVLRRGGGIMSTVRDVRGCREEDLARQLGERLRDLPTNEAIGALEIKSGYGLNTQHEMAMLRAIAACARDVGVPVVPTALLGHAIDPDVPRERFIRAMIEETLPAVSREFPGIAVDAFCEQGAWTLDECAALLSAAQRLGHPCRVHADQFTALGMTPWACEHGFRSVDHLEAVNDTGVEALAASGSVGVVLPACGFHLDGRYANARRLIDAGAALALATNCNPGSAPCRSMALVIALAVRFCGMRCEEAITAATVNAAHVLVLPDMGTIAPGQRASFAVLASQDERSVCYEIPAQVRLLDLSQPASASA